MAVQIQFRRDTAARWLENDPILAQGEIGLELDTGRIKLGNGVQAWSELDYFFDLASIAPLTANWQSAYTTVGTNSGSWDYQGTDIKALTANWQDTYTILSASSADWNSDSDNQTLTFDDNSGILTISSGNTVSLSALSGSAETDPIFSTWAQANSANYDSTYTTVQSNSASWDYQGTDLKGLTANYDSTYTTVNVNSASWDYQGTDLKALTANYDSTYTTVNVNSASWGLDSQILLFDEATGELSISNGNIISLSALSGGGGTLTNETDPIFTTWAQSYSANYDSTYTTVQTNSASWDYQGTDLKGLTANYDSTYTTVNVNSASWDYQGTDLKGLTGNWESTYTTVQTNSSSWGTGGAGGGAGVTVSDSAPSSPSIGDLWFDSNAGSLYVWYTDEDSGQWVLPDANLASTSTSATNISFTPLSSESWLTPSPVNVQEALDELANTRVTSSNSSIRDIIALTQAEYDALSASIVSTTLYIITD